MSRVKTRPLKISGSCHCGAVSFSVKTFTPYPFNVCHCTVCRKTAGFNTCVLEAVANTLAVEGVEFMKAYQARMTSVCDPENPTAKVEEKDDSISLSNTVNLKLSSYKRYFCQECGCYLYAQDARYAKSIYPFASCIDSELPQAPEEVHSMTSFKASHEDYAAGSFTQTTTDNKSKQSHSKTIICFDKFPDQSIEDWHKARGLYGVLASRPSAASMCEDT